MEELNREKYLQQCKDRSLLVLDSKDPEEAVFSMIQCLSENKLTSDMAEWGASLGVAALINPSRRSVERFIVGFN